MSVNVEVIGVKSRSIYCFQSRRKVDSPLIQNKSDVSIYLGNKDIQAIEIPPRSYISFSKKIDLSNICIRNDSDKDVDIAIIYYGD